MQNAVWHVRDLLRVFLLVFGSLAVDGWATEGRTESQPTNLVFILTDNQGAWTLGCYGNPDIRTPHIDRCVGRKQQQRRTHQSLVAHQTQRQGRAAASRKL